MMTEPAMISLTVFSFLMTMLLILLRPRGLNEAVPAVFGAVLVLFSGSVTLADLGQIGTTISGAAITIMATIVMAIVLESFGFFQWAAEGLAARARGSGIRLFWYVNLICFLMTLFFNNDGSILITTPILLILLKRLGLKNHHKIPYLLSGALIATASSAPIGVSNIVNLIALKIVGMDLYMHTLMMFVPSMLGLLFLVALLFLYYRERLPVKLPHRAPYFHGPGHHPLQHPADVTALRDRDRFMQRILLFVFLVRCSLFLASYLAIPIDLVAVLGSVLLLLWRWWALKIPPKDMLRKTPWHIFVFAFGMYVIIYGLNNIGLTQLLVTTFEPWVQDSLLSASFVMGGLTTLMSLMFNNHPALMIGTMTLTGMELDPLILKTAYLAAVIGSDLGALLLPIGTLASLIWLGILKEHKVNLPWKEYVKVTFATIPPAMLFTLFLLAYWIEWVYGSVVP
ncbi:arsenical pump membrane protein [Paenibacillus mucilaginosus 3016]|uniref:Arsenical pump membrane protein n=1 Tax=Paenibacillus mucilaginosus 3016 TaxID=1116391 RepID=H6NA42_9BACL|nr:arsenic transporter [Paenibacillus mucilaginosus]AFC28886.1 arsenical pump membrane protein [Paenibacillus mucilaginosus 3016]WFA17641.1 arsenic transporter [Paenibacillus mucilaginosus]